MTVVRDGDFVGVGGADGVCRRRRRWPRSRPSGRRSPQVSGKELFEHLKDKAGRGGGGRRPRRRRCAGRPGLASKPALKAADKTVKATYTIAYIAHVPLEPRAAVAEWEDGKLTVWTGTQRPFGVRGELASALGVPAEKRPRDRARHGLRLRRQAHRRGGDRGGAAGEGRRQAGQARLDARGGIHLGLLPPGRA